MVFVQPFHDFSSAKHEKSFVTEMTISEIFYKKNCDIFPCRQHCLDSRSRGKGKFVQERFHFKKILVMQIMTFIVRF